MHPDLLRQHDLLDGLQLRASDRRAASVTFVLAAPSTALIFKPAARAWPPPPNPSANLATSNWPFERRLTRMGPPSGGSTNSSATSTLPTCSGMLMRFSVAGTPAP